MISSDPARSAVLDTLSDAIDRFHHMEKKHRKAGKLALAEGTHQYLVWVQRAYKAEFGDPKPKAME